MPISRRSAVLAALGTAVAGVGAGTVALQLEGATEGMSILNDEEVSVVEALCEVWFPAGVFPLSGLEAGVPSGVDEVLGDIMEALQLAGFRYVLRTLQWSPLARWGRRFTELEVEERIVVLDRWSDADVVPRRAAVDAVKAVLAIPYFRHPTIVAAIGWRTGCSGAPS